MNRVILRYIDVMPETDAPPADLPECERVQLWRAYQVCRLVPTLSLELAEIVAETIDWHELDAMIEAGCDPRVALRILV